MGFVHDAALICLFIFGISGLATPSNSAAVPISAPSKAGILLTCTLSPLATSDMTSPVRYYEFFPGQDKFIAANNDAGEDITEVNITQTIISWVDPNGGTSDGNNGDYSINRSTLAYTEEDVDIDNPDSVALPFAGSCQTAPLPKSVGATASALAHPIL